MKKRLIAVLLSMLTIIFAMPFSLADNDKVEISFKVGDNVLSINGVETEVETPYVAGEGTTLVPLRVITEAFGAQVDWQDKTKTITLSYPDVNIVLQINNIIAKVNDHNETLLEAPALSENGVTMVPLRFISETFGASVNYDNSTGKILVTKEKVGDGQTVIGTTEMEKTGDSYYGWSIDTPKQMQMTYRRLDGLSTEFTADDESELYIDVHKYTKDTITPFDEKFSNIKDSFSKYTLTEAEKLTDESGNQYMHFQAKDKDTIIDYCEYYGQNYTTYNITAYINISDDTSIKNMILSISNSFKLGNLDNQTYDLSNVSDNMRIIQDDKYKLNFKIPADFMQRTNSDSENEFYFVSPNADSHASVSLAIYSKSSDITAQTLAQNDHDNRIKSMNIDFSTISDVICSDDNIYSYTHHISGSSKNDEYIIDTFFEKGEYVYNMAVSVDSINDAQKANTIISSLQTEELDTSKIGKLLRNDPDENTMSTNKISNYSFELPTSWKTISSGQIGSDSYNGLYLNITTGATISFMKVTDSEYKKGSLSETANAFKKHLEQNSKIKIVNNIAYTNLDDYRYAYFTYKSTQDNGEVIYSTVYIKTDTNELIVFSLSENEIYYQKSGNETFLNGILSLKKN